MVWKNNQKRLFAIPDSVNKHAFHTMTPRSDRAAGSVALLSQTAAHEVAAKTLKLNP